MRKPRSSQPPGATDRRRWFLFAGQSLTVEDIAEREGVASETVQDSLDRCREYRFRHSNEMVALRINEIAIRALERGVPQVFDRGLNAQKYVPSGKGKFAKVPDVSMQLKTVETIKSLHEVSQPKAPLVQNNTQLNNNFNNPGYQQGMSFEARLRLIREKRGLSNDEEDSVVDAEVANEEETVAEELEGIGIDLDDGDEEEDGDALPT